jgi:hypothetical protein
MAISLPSKKFFQRRSFQAAGLAAVFSMAAISSSCSPSTETGHPMLPTGYVDAPQNGATAKGTVATSGWALSEDGIGDVEIYIDRAFVTSATPAIPRPDVLAKYSNFKNDPNPGWSASVDLSQITPGTHEFTVEARSKKGAVSNIGSVLLNISH